MKIAKALSESEAKKVQTFVLLGGVFTTLTIWTKLEDPVNLPKMFVLVLSAAIVAGLTLPIMLSAKNLQTRNKKIALGLVSLFVIGLTSATIMTDVKYTALFGEFHRNNGFFSYLAMSILMVASIFVFNVGKSKRFFIFFANTGLTLTAYGFLQGLGKDPIGWVITYNPFITTLGNPNFTSAFLGISGIAILYLSLASDKKHYRALYSIGLICNLYILYRSGSIQGLFGFAIGATLIVIVKLWILGRKYGLAAGIFAILAALPVTLAVFNIGPLSSKIYQGSLRNRLDYWHAAIDMFKDHPVFGVGIDRFGEHYRQYAVQNQVVQGQSTDNAHSVYLQIFSTGGLITGLPYLMLILFITFIGLLAVVRSANSEKLAISGLLATWLGMLAVNIVTIDNLGVAVWFWIIGGVLVASSNGTSQIEVANEKRSDKRLIKKPGVNSEVKFPLSTLTSFTFAVVVLVSFMPVLNRSEILYNFKSNNFSGPIEGQIPALVYESERNKNNPQQLIQLANIALSKNSPREAIKMIERVNEIDSKSYYGNYFAAIAYEAIAQPSEAVKYRENLLVLDKWNTENMLQLVRNYLTLGDRASAEEIGKIIAKYFPKSQAVIDSRTLLSS
jgi:O-antigen ligase